MKALRWSYYICIGGLAWGVIAFPGRSAEPTAFDLIKEGNKYVGEHAKDKVVQIRSEKSIGSLTPNIWYIVYYDHTAALKAAEVKFGAGKFLDLKRPFRLFEPITGGDDPLERDKLKVDSDEALRIARKEPLLENLELKATRLKLERGEAGMPVWKVKLYAARLKKPGEDVDIGEIHLRAETGEVIKRDLKIQRVAK